MSISAVTSAPPSPKAAGMAKKESVARFSISVPSELADHLDLVVAERGYKNRSQAVAEMVRNQLAEYHADLGKASMAGTISLVYDHRKRNLQQTLSSIQHKYYLMVVTSMHVHLENQNYMEVLLVQGKAPDLQQLADELTTCRGVRTGKLNLTATAMPPLL